MSSTVKTILGAILLVLGVVSLLQFGFAILLRSPGLIVGVLLTAGGAALLTSAKQSNKYLP